MLTEKLNEIHLQRNTVNLVSDVSCYFTEIFNSVNIFYIDNNSVLCLSKRVYNFFSWWNVYACNKLKLYSSEQIAGNISDAEINPGNKSKQYYINNLTIPCKCLWPLPNILALMTWKQSTNLDVNYFCIKISHLIKSKYGL